MAKIFSSSLNKRFSFYFILISIFVITLFTYTAITSSSSSLKKEAQQRVNEGLETLSLVFNDNLDQLYYSTESFAQRSSIQEQIIKLSQIPDYNIVKNEADYTDLKKKLIDEIDARELSFIDIIDENGKILVSGNSDQVGQRLSLKGFVGNVLKNKTSSRSIEQMSADELKNENETLAEQAKIRRIPTINQKEGWRQKDEETDGLIFSAVSIIKSNDQVAGAIVSGILLNNNNIIPDRIVQRGGGIATIYLYDARIATNQIIAGSNKRASGTLASEEVVNSVYISQQEYSGRAYELNDWFLVAYQPIKNYDNEVIGSLARGIKESEATAGVGELRTRFIIVGLLAFIAIYLATFYLSRSITRPIKELASNSYRISRGNLEIEIPPPEREDEIGDLTHSFIIMKEKLREYYTKLEDLVAQRTKELRQKVKDLERARHTIEDEKNKSESILQNVGDGVLALDKNKKFIACNEAASDLLDLSIEKIINYDLNEIISLKNTKLTETSRNFNPIVEAIERGKVVSTGTGDFSVLTSKKKEIPVTITATPLKDNTGEIHGGVVVIKDVTKEQEIDKMKSEFVSVASHQLRTPLSASKWFLEMLINKEAGIVNKEQAEYLDHIYKSNERMIALVNDLLNVSRIESGTIAIEPVQTDIEGLINSVIFELTPQIKNKKIKVPFEKPAGGIPQIKIDPKLIRQVFQNLLSNAVKYTPEKGTVGVRVKKDPKYLTFEVYDTGVGIPKKQQAKVFKKFFRADNVITLQTEGTGLGLYVAKSVVDASGGKIWFKSEEGRGTSFLFTLPLAGSQRREGEKTLI